MALPPLASVIDLSDWLGRDLPPGDPRAVAVLSHASTRVRAYARMTWVNNMGALLAVPDAARDVTVRVAARAWRNPEDLDSVTLDDGTKRWGDVRGMALTDEDREDLGQFRPVGSTNGLGILSTYRDDPGVSTIYVPTGPGPSGYPFPFLDPSDL